MKQTTELVADYVQQDANSAVLGHQRQMRNQTGKSVSSIATVAESEVRLIQIHKKKQKAVKGKQTKTRMHKIRVFRKILPTKVPFNEGRKDKITTLRCQVNQCSFNQEIPH